MRLCTDDYWMTIGLCDSINSLVCFETTASIAAAKGEVASINQLFFVQTVQSVSSESFELGFLPSIVNLVAHHSPVAPFSSCPLLPTATLSPSLPASTSTISLKPLACLHAVTVMFTLNMAKSWLLSISISIYNII